MGNGRGFFSSVSFATFRTSDTITLFHLRRRGIKCRARSGFADSTCKLGVRCNLSSQVPCVTTCQRFARHGYAAPLEVNRLCSSTLSVNCEQVTKKHGRKILCRSLFRSGHMSAICAGLGSKGKGRSSRETAVSLPFAHRRGYDRRSRRPQTANPPLRFRKKLPPGKGEHANAVRAPGFPVQKRSRPVRANTLTQFAPRWVGAKNFSKFSKKVDHSRSIFTSIRHRVEGGDGQHSNRHTQQLPPKRRISAIW